MTDIFFASGIKVKREEDLRSLDLAHVFGLRPLRPLDDVKTDAISLGERFETLARDGGKVNENVWSVVLFDKTKPFGVIEPLDCTFCQFSLHDTVCGAVLAGYQPVFQGPTVFEFNLIDYSSLSKGLLPGKAPLRFADVPEIMTVHHPGSAILLP